MSDWWASRMLVSVKSTRSCSSSQCAKRAGPSSSSFCLVPGAGVGSATGRQAHRGKSGRTRAVLGLGVAVDDDVADEGEDAAGAVALARPVQQRRRRLDEARGVVPAREAWMRDELIEEAQVRDHAADAEFRERAVHARDGLLRRGRPGSHLHQQRVIGARDDGAGVGGAGVQAHAEAGGTAVGGDLAVVGNEVVFRILGRDPALQRVRTDADLRLRRHAALGGADACAGGDAQLRLDEVDAGGAFGDRVLNLDAGVDLDEVEAAAVRILQEFHRAGVLRRRPRARCRAPSRTAGRAPAPAGTPPGSARPPSGCAAARCSRARTGAPASPCASPSTCTSTWRARRTNFSAYTSSLPKPGECLAARGGSSSASCASPSITRVPRPPPPQLALSITG